MYLKLSHNFINLNDVYYKYILLLQIPSFRRECLQSSPLHGVQKNKSEIEINPQFRSGWSDFNQIFQRERISIREFIF